MKKLLSLLSILTISGTAVPTTIAVSPYQKEKTLNSDNLKKLNRVKRETNLTTVIERIGYWTEEYKRKNNKADYIIFITPNFFEEIIKIHKENNFNELKNELKNKLTQVTSIYWNDFPEKYLGIIKNNWNSINNLWQNSVKRNRIGIYIKSHSTTSGMDISYFEYISSHIMSEEKNIENKYLEKLWTDFNGDLSKESIDLGIIEDKNDNFILNKLKEKYPNLNISYFEVFEKKDYSFFDKSFSTKFKIKSNNELIYPIQNFNYKFTFITKKWLNEDLPKLIDNENLIKNWKSNFSNWQNETNRQINEDLPKYGNDERGKALKRTWKGTNINELNNKLLSLNHILETIDSKFKLNELYSKVQNLEKDVNELKSQINKLNQKISEIQNSLNKNEDLENCANIGGLISASTSWIPYIGTLISTVSGTAAAICTIANA